MKEKNQTAIILEYFKLVKIIQNLLSQRLEIFLFVINKHQRELKAS
jgi:hypothetical protein